MEGEGLLGELDLAAEFFVGVFLVVLVDGFSGHFS